MTPFAGIPADAFDFYDELRAENTRTWWQANAARYAASVREPLEALLDALEDLTGAGFDLGGDQVATRPRGVPAEHPRLGLMRFKNLIAKREHRPRTR